MRIRFWGTRGSIPTPGASTARYGGNTSCVEVRSGSGTLVVIDCGTGAHALSQKLCAPGSAPLRGHILISHTHWDHIQGIPFFRALFVPGNEWDIYGPKGLLQGLRETLAGQMQHTYFPVALEELGATIRYHDLVEGKFMADDIEVTTHYLNHPALTLGYRLEADGASLVYCCDHEPHSLAMASGEGALTGQDRRHVDFVAGADLVVHDAQYTASDFPAKAGWGHSSAEYAIRICAEAGVKQVALTHHDPLRNDDAVDRILADMRLRARTSGSALEVLAAAEGHVIEIQSRAAGRPNPAKARFQAQMAIDTAATSRPVLVWVIDERKRTLLFDALAQERLAGQIPADESELLSMATQLRPSLAIVEHAPPRIDAIRVIHAVRQQEAGQPVKVPVPIIADDEQSAIPGSEDASEWLVWPLTVSYARAKIRAWVLRTASRWTRARLPGDEKHRLEALHALALLDTPREERFDRLTRIAAAAFTAPIALVSLIDSERQWFKSCIGLDVAETSRDMAFCAHAVHQRTDLIVPDALQDERFADNPLVQNEPRIRFYAGAPLILNDGSCIGTLCLLDVRPRQLSDAEVAVLHDLRDLVLEEIQAPRNRRTAD